MSYEIEKNVPAPKKGKDKYPFDKMLIGDSFRVSIVEHYGDNNKVFRWRLQNLLSTAGRQYGNIQNPPVKFCTKIEGDYVRIWRIK